MPLPAPALRLLDRQFGVVGRFQLLDAMSRGEIDGFVQRRLLVPVQRGVYRSSGGVLTPAAEAMTGVLRCRPGATVTGPRVLGLLGVDGVRPDAPFEVLIRPDRRRPRVDFPVRVDPDPWRSRARFGTSLPIVRPVDAIIDSARWVDDLGERAIRAAYDAARWANLITTSGVRARARELGTRDPGARFFLELDADGDATSESEPERVLGHVFGPLEPPLEPQVWVLPDVRTDWLWRRYRLIFEYQGEVDHATAIARLRDDRRIQRLEAQGYMVVPVVAADLADHDALRRWALALAATRAHVLGIGPPEPLTNTSRHVRG